MKKTISILLIAVTHLACAADPETQAVSHITPQATQVISNIPLAHVEGVNTDPNIQVPEMYAAWPHINIEEVQRLLKEKGVVFADARSKTEWEVAHIPGAVSVPLGTFDTDYLASYKKFKDAKIIVAYCHGVGCHLSDKACSKFQEKGHKNVVNFYAGWPAWSSANMPMEDKNGKSVEPTPIPTALPTAKP